MKRLLIIFSFLIFFSCGEDERPDLDGVIEQFTVVLTSGDWKIDFFFDDDDDKTGEYEGYVFRYSVNGQVEAFLDGQSVDTGTWSTRTQDGAILFIINFPDGTPLGELSDDWFLAGFGDDIIDLQEENDLDSVDEDRIVFVLI